MSMRPGPISKPPPVTTVLLFILAQYSLAPCLARVSATPRSGTLMVSAGMSLVAGIVAVVTGIVLVGTEIL